MTTNLKMKPTLCEHAGETYWDDQAYRNVYYLVCCQCGYSLEVDEHGIPYEDSEWEE